MVSFATRTRRAALLSSAAGLVLSGMVPALAQSDSDDLEEVEEVVVTGSRLNVNSNLTSSSPILTVGSEEIALRGSVRVEDLVNILPQVFAAQTSEVSNGASGIATLDLRGLGSVRTLVMIDGRRLPFGASNTSSVNADLVPAQLVDRVDVTTGGGSAVYGSDAIAGVVNFVLKRDYEGLELDAQGAFHQNGNSSDFFSSILSAGGQPIPGASTDGEEINLAMTLGANSADGRGNVTLFANYQNQSAIIQRDRIFSACTLNASTSALSFQGFGCGGSANFRLFGGPGGFGFQEESGNVISFVGGPAQTFNFGAQNFYQRPQERFSIYVRGHYELTENMELFADMQYLTNDSDAQIAPTASFGIGAYQINCDNPLIQGNSGISFATIFGCDAAGVAPDAIVSGITASHRNVEGGERNSRLTNSTMRGVVGLRGTFADNFDYEVFGQYAETSRRSVATQDFVVSRLQQAFLVTTDANGNAVCTDPSNGCVPYNIFQRGPNGESLVTQEALQFIQGTGFVTGTTEQAAFGANVQTDLGNYGWQSPWSDNGVAILAGYEYRQDKLSSNPDEISQIQGGGFTGVGGATLPVEGSLEVNEFYAELQVPIVDGKEFFQELTFSAQYRYSDYGTNGTVGTSTSSGSFATDSYGFGLTWTPVSDIKFRAQLQRAVRAPNVIELYTGQNIGLGNLNQAGVNSLGTGLFDPCASAAPIAPLSQCVNTGVSAAQYGNILDVISGQTQIVTGGNPGLSPEVSDTLTLGVVITPEAIPGLSLTVDYFDIEVDQVISAGIPVQVTLDQCLATGDPIFCDLIQRDGTGSLAAGSLGFGFTSTNLNIASLETSGLDFQLVYTFDLEEVGLGDAGQVTFDYFSTYLDTFDFTPFPGGTAIECAGKFGNACWTPVNPSYRHRFLTTWNHPIGLATNVTWRYFGGTTNQSAAAAGTIDERLGAKNYIDLSFGYRLADNLNLRFGVNNLFNTFPPISVSAGAPLGNGNTYPGSFDTGRFVFLGVNFTL